MTANPPPHPSTPRAYPVFPAPTSAAGVTQPTPGAPPVFTGAAPVSSGGRSPRLGVIALVIAITAAAGASILSAVTAYPAAVGAMTDALTLSPEGLENLSSDQLLMVLSPVRGLVLWAEIGFWAGTVLGIWAFVQGIVAIATRRGRGAGIAAVIIAALGPVVFSLIVGASVLGGITAGAA